MAVPSFVHDANLRLPIDDPAWRQFLARHGVDVVGFSGDMAPLTERVAKDTTTFAYLPAAYYFAIRDHAVYEPIASAVSAADGTASFASVLTVPASSEVRDVDDLAGRRLGTAHRYCTSSFLAPAVLLAEHGHRIEEFLGALVIVPPYQGQIDAMLAGTVDATMVEEDVWQRTASNAETTRVIARKDGLPTPLLIVHRAVAPDLRVDLAKLVLGHRPEITPETLFAGFVAYQRAAIEQFFDEAAAALA